AEHVVLAALGLAEGVQADADHGAEVDGERDQLEGELHEGLRSQVGKGGRAGSEVRAPRRRSWAAGPVEDDAPPYRRSGGQVPRILRRGDADHLVPCPDGDLGADARTPGTPRDA